MNKRRFTRSALACATLLLAAITSQAQPLSNKPIRIVVPFGAGGVADVTSRVVAQKLASQLGQPVIIDNKPSAGGIVAADTVAKSAPDGHTLFLMSNGSAVTVGLFNQLPFDMVKDFTPISTLGYFDIGVLTASDSRFKNLGELVAWAKANPGKLNIGSIAIGSTQHLAAELFKTTAGIDAQIVPFNGTPAVVTALRGRQIDVAVEILTPIMGQINSKAVNLLAITGDKRSALLPGVPTPPALAPGWLGVCAALAVVYVGSNLALQYAATRLPANATSVLMITEVLWAAGSALLLGAGSLTLPLALDRKSVV